MEMSEYQTLSPGEKARLALVAIIKERGGGGILVSSGMLAAVNRCDRVEINIDEEFPKICWAKCSGDGSDGQSHRR